eukprot:11724475-Ditylum_brightwellii.AAC.1
MAKTSSETRECSALPIQQHPNPDDALDFTTAYLHGQFNTSSSSKWANILNFMNDNDDFITELLITPRNCM